MKDPTNPGRRALLQQAALGLSLSPLVLTAPPAQAAADLPLLSEQDPAAKAVHYVEDARRAKGASGAECSNCSIYSAAAGAASGTCTLFPGKLVKAAGWCSQWSGL